MFEGIKKFITGDSGNRSSVLSNSAMNHRSDGWYNILTGLGKLGADKATYTDIFWSQLHFQEAEAIYAADPLARRIVDYIIDAALFHNFTFSVTEKDEDENIKFNESIIRTFNEKFDIHDLISRTAKESRIYGGAYILLGVEDGKLPLDPLDLNTIRSVKYLQRFNPNEIYPISPGLNPSRSNYLSPEFYSVNTYGGHANLNIHHSRVIRFDGHHLTRRHFISNGYIHDSILNSIRNLLANYHQSIAAIAYAVQDYSIGEFKMEGLRELIQAGKEDKVISRLTIMNKAQSIVRARILDTSEEFTKTTGQYSGLSDLVSTLRRELATQCDMPHTILFNEGPNAGTHGISSGKGDSELSDWQAKVSEYQKYRLKPKIRRLYDVLFSAQDNKLTKGKIPEYDIEFQAARSMSQKEEAEAYQDFAAADQMYLDMGVITPLEIRRSRFAPYGTFGRFQSKIQIENPEEDVSQQNQPPEQEPPQPEENETQPNSQQPDDPKQTDPQMPRSGDKPPEDDEKLPKK